MCFIALKMSSITQRTSKGKPRSLKCWHSLSHLIITIIALPVEKQIGEMIPVLLLNLCNICSGFSDEQMQKVKNRKCYVRKQKQTLQNTINLIRWVTRMWSPLLDLRQTLRILLTIYLLLHHILNPCVSSHCLLKLQLKLSLLTQVQLYNRKSSPTREISGFSV